MKLLIHKKRKNKSNPNQTMRISHVIKSRAIWKWELKIDVGLLRKCYGTEGEAHSIID